MFLGRVISFSKEKVTPFFEFLQPELEKSQIDSSEVLNGYHYFAAQTRYCGQHEGQKALLAHFK
jgi:hypothetical protein